MTTTSNWFGIEPVPASRPRVRTIRTKDGRQFTTTYYAGKYKQFIKDAEKAIPQSPVLHEGPLRVLVICVVTKPKTTKRDYPRGDWDNFAKGPCDAMTKAGYWNDDDQIVDGSCVKQFAGEFGPRGHEFIDPGVYVEIEELV